ncbi:hypothetical protein ACE1MS_23520 (plasmid) [Lysinibacillus sp. fkY74-1]
MDFNLDTTISIQTLENLVKLPIYTVAIQMNMANFNFELLTNYKFIASNKEAAIKKAASMLNKLIPFLKVYYDTNAKELAIQIKDNYYFNCVELWNFEIFDESQYNLVTNRTTTNHAITPNWYSFVTKEQFYEHLEIVHNNTMHPNKLVFEAVGYGIALINSNCR